MPKKLIYPKPRYEDMDAVISKRGHKTEVIDSWRYYSIMDALRWMGAERVEAQDAAKRCCRTHEETTFKVGDITIELMPKEETKSGKDLFHRSRKTADRD